MCLRAKQLRILYINRRPVKRRLNPGKRLESILGMVRSELASNLGLLAGFLCSALIGGFADILIGGKEKSGLKDIDGLYLLWASGRLGRICIGAYGGYSGKSNRGDSQSYRSCIACNDHHAVRSGRNRGKCRNKPSSGLFEQHSNQGNSVPDSAHCARRGAFWLLSTT